MPLVGVWSPRTWLTMVFRSWMLLMARSSLEAQTTELARLNTALGKKKESIWSMNKAELVETARKELGLTLKQANDETVTTLREKLRRVRKATTVMIDPLATLPKGLEKLTLQELKEEAVVRGLPEPEPVTRAKLIVLIRDDVDTRTRLEQPPSSSTTARNQSTRPNPGGLTAAHFDDDWEMTQDSARRRADRR